MGQISFSDAEYAGKRKKTRREVFFDEMELMVPWKALLGLDTVVFPRAQVEVESAGALIPPGQCGWPFRRLAPRIPQLAGCVVGDPERLGPAGEVNAIGLLRTFGSRRYGTRPVVDSGGVALSSPGSSCHWITSSARASSDCGIVRPSIFAVLRLIVSTNLVGCSRGKSATLAPLRILST